MAFYQVFVREQTPAFAFAIEKGAAPQTLLAAVTEENSATVPTNNIPQSSEKINTPDKKSSDRTDSDYLAAVESGDMKTAQQMVDEAAMIKPKNGYMNNDFCI